MAEVANKLGKKSGYAAAAVLVCGVFIGSSLWWLSLSTGTGLLRDRLSDSVTVWLNRISGSVIFIFGLAALFSVL